MFSGVCPRVYITYVERRGKPPTWLPRLKLAEERIPSATTKIENFLRTENGTKIENCQPHELDARKQSPEVQGIFPNRS